MKTTDKVRRMLAQGLDAPEIAKKLKIRPAYVHTVKWLDKKKKKTQTVQVERSHDPKVVEAEKDYLKTVKRTLDVIQKTPYMKAAFEKPKEDPQAKRWDEKNSWFGKKPTKLLVQPRYKLVQPRYEDGAMKILADNDLVNHPPHYTKGGIDYWDFAEAKGLTENAYLFNAGKYIVRCGKKEGADPIQDLEKAIKFIQRDIDRRKRA